METGRPEFVGAIGGSLIIRLHVRNRGIDRRSLCVPSAQMCCRRGDVYNSAVHSEMFRLSQDDHRARSDFVVGFLLARGGHADENEHSH